MGFGVPAGSLRRVSGLGQKRESLYSKKAHCDYFIKWWRILRPDLQSVGAVDAHAIESSNQKVDQRQAQLEYAETANLSKRQLDVVYNVCP